MIAQTILLEGKPYVNTMENSKRTSGGRKAPIVVALALCGAMLFGWAVMEWRSMSRSPDRLDLMATVEPDTEFWLDKRISGKHYWERNPFPRDQAVAVLQAMTTAQSWEPNGKWNFSFKRSYIFPRDLKGALVWGKDMKDNAEARGNVLWIYYGNEIINNEGKDYVVPVEGREILDRIFPIEEEKDEKGGHERF
jgi:hypothetical protein